MIYTVRYCHLAKPTNLKVGQTVKSGDTIGTMGNTGESYGDHLHIDCVYGEHSYLYRLFNMETENPKACPKELNYFIDKDLFGVSPVITTYYADPFYSDKFKKLHLGYDVVPTNRKNTKENYCIKWNRSYAGKVINIGYDLNGYGNYVYITYEK